jgi:hypothetical protein
MARVFLGIGAYWFLISISTTVRAAPLSSSLAFTLPTLTPARRTSASTDRVAASPKAASKR